ncbi:hypothetical protein F4777DRAFT_89378 [Nemania sp. FL0916]|nr:hypothetical protein F4777DRAFT_89378 [Nemania sp. FL0916]
MAKTRMWRNVTAWCCAVCRATLCVRGTVYAKRCLCLARRKLIKRWRMRASRHGIGKKKFISIQIRRKELTGDSQACSNTCKNVLPILSQ